MKSEFFCHSCMKWEPSSRIGGVVSEKRYCIDTIEKARKRIAANIEGYKTKPTKVTSNHYTEAQLKAKKKRLERFNELQEERDLAQINKDIYGYEDM